MTGRHRGVGGEHAARADLVDVGRLGLSGGGGEPAEQGQGEQGGVTLVHVVGGDLGVAELLQDGDSAHAEHDLLAEPVLEVTPVELVGDQLVLGFVGGDPGVEEVDGDPEPGDPGDLEAPDRHHHLAVADLAPWPGR